MQTIFVKPLDGLKIRMPDDPGKFLPENGADVPDTQFWRRRIKEGSVQRATRPAAKKEEKSK